MYQVSHLLDAYFGSLFTDALQIQLHSNVWELVKKEYLREIQVQKSACVVTRANSQEYTLSPLSSYKF